MSLDFNNSGGPMQGVGKWAEGLQANKLAAISALALGIIVTSALLAPWIAPQNPFDLTQLSLWDSRLPPGSVGRGGTLYLLGTDDQGRDILSAILYGLRISLSVAFIATVIAVLIGVTLGATAAFWGGRVDAVIMRIVDFQLGFPAILIALILLSVLGRGVDRVILALVAVQWAYYARTVRGVALVERNKDYIEAALGLGLGKLRVLMRHLIPNCLSSLVVVATVEMASAITLEATLSFLGLGTPITAPSLGLLIANGYQYMLSGMFWISFYPGVALLITVMSVNIAGDWLRDTFNPRLQR
jgi:peptide/nickel transport system permease protein